MSEFWLAHLTFPLLAFAILPYRGAGRLVQTSLLLCLTAAGFMQIDGLPLAAYLRSFTDDLAIPSLLFLGWVALIRLRLVSHLEPRQRWPLLALFGLLALILYPATLGLTYFDPYRFGYSPRLMLLVMAAVSLALLLARNWPGAVLLLAATLAFALGLKPSGNYWDYLLDPFAALYAWGMLLFGKRWRPVTRPMQKCADPGPASGLPGSP